jgi:NIMA (never in mitosis gene a)-related kinase
MSDKERNSALNEVRILASIKNHNVIGFKEAFIDHKDSSLCIIMEYCDGGDLNQKIEYRKDNKECISERTIW